MTKVSFYKSVTQPYDKEYIEIKDVFKRIKNSRYKDLISTMRACYPSDEYDKHKIKLPAYRFSGVFTSGTDKGIKEHSGLICLDFDKLDDVDSYKEYLISNQYTYACFLSPSAKGFKVIVKIPNVIADHKSHFKALEFEYGSDYWDGSSVNISRACFDSYDPDIYINEKAKVFTKKIYEDAPIADENVRVPIKSSNEIIIRIQSWFDSKYDPNARNSSMFILAAALNRYGIQKHECDSYIKSRYSSIGLSDEEMDKIIKNAYSHKDLFNSQQFEDREVINRTRKNIRDGKSVRSIRNNLNDYNDDEKDVIINQSKTFKEQGDFWSKTDKGQITIYPDKYKTFLSTNGFYKYYNSELSYLFIRVEHNFIREVSEDLIKDFVLGTVYELDDKSIYNYLANQTRLFKKDYLSLIDAKEVEFIRDEPDKSFIFFSNCLVEITSDVIDIKMYADFSQHVWKKQVIKRDFKEGESDCDFKQFIYNISGKDDLRFNSFKSVIGYMLHTYKTPFFSPCIILNDEDISDNPQGGTGKGLLIEALSKFKNVCTLNGKNFDASKDFAFQRVNLDTQILIFDDVQEHFSFESLFSVITDGMPINKKNKDEFFIEKDKTPKIAIPTNYVLKGEGNSHERRKFEVELSNHYTKEFTPYHDFKRNMFYDWDMKEWSQFDNFMIECIQYYLKNGLVDYLRVNLNEKKMRSSLGADFLTWVTENFQTNHRFKLKDVFDKFTSEYPTYKKFSQKYISGRMRIYGDFLIKKGEIDRVMKSKENGLPFIEFVKELELEPINDCPI